MKVPRKKLFQTYRDDLGGELTISPIDNIGGIFKKVACLSKMVVFL